MASKTLAMPPPLGGDVTEKERRPCINVSGQFNAYFLFFQLFATGAPAYGYASAMVFLDLPEERYGAWRDATFTTLIDTVILTSLLSSIVVDALGPRIGALLGHVFGVCAAITLAYSTANPKNPSLWTIAGVFIGLQAAMMIISASLALQKLFKPIVSPLNIAVMNGCYDSSAIIYTLLGVFVTDKTRSAGQYQVILMAYAVFIACVGVAAWKIYVPMSQAAAITDPNPPPVADEDCGGDIVINQDDEATSVAGGGNIVVRQDDEALSPEHTIVNVHDMDAPVPVKLDTTPALAIAAAAENAADSADEVDETSPSGEFDDEGHHAQLARIAAEHVEKKISENTATTNCSALEGASTVDMMSDMTSVMEGASTVDMTTVDMTSETFHEGDSVRSSVMPRPSTQSPNESYSVLEGQPMGHTPLWKTVLTDREYQMYLLWFSAQFVTFTTYQGSCFLDFTDEMNSIAGLLYPLSLPASLFVGYLFGKVGGVNGETNGRVFLVTSILGCALQAFFVALGGMPTSIQWISFVLLCLYRSGMFSVFWIYFPPIRDIPNLGALYGMAITPCFLVQRAAWAALEAASDDRDVQKACWLGYLFVVDVIYCAYVLRKNNVA